MKTKKWILLILVITSFIGAVLADEKEKRLPGHGGMEPRAKGIPQHGTFHTVLRAGKPQRSPVFHDHRAVVEVRRDPHIVVFNHAGWHPVGHWDHWYRDWGVFWRVNDWAEIQTVTCEAVDTQTEYLYPVTETRATNWHWSGELVNNVAARALDECVAESSHPETCVLVERECWNSVF